MEATTIRRPRPGPGKTNFGFTSIAAPRPSVESRRVLPSGGWRAALRYPKPYSHSIINESDNQLILLACSAHQKSDTVTCTVAQQLKPNLRQSTRHYANAPSDVRSVDGPNSDQMLRRRETTLRANIRREHVQQIPGN